MYPSEAADKFMLRFPQGMRDHIKVQAALNRRSMNAEINYQLARSYGLMEAAGSEGSIKAPAASSNTDACQGADINHTA